MLKITFANGQEKIGSADSFLAHPMSDKSLESVRSLYADGPDAVQLASIVPQYFGKPPATHFQTRSVPVGGADPQEDPDEAQAILRALYDSRKAR